MPKYTQQQLEEAYKQMEDERGQEKALAQKAAGWISQQLGMKHSMRIQVYAPPIGLPPWHRDERVTPQPNQWMVQIEYCQYDNYFNHPFVTARLQIPPNFNQNHIDRLTFDVDMSNVAGFPQGFIMKVGFNYYDAHGCGF